MVKHPIRLDTHTLCEERGKWSQGLAVRALTKMVWRDRDRVWRGEARTQLWGRIYEEVVSRGSARGCEKCCEVCYGHVLWI